MDNVGPLRSFAEIQERRPQSEYCVSQTDDVIELEPFACGVYCVRTWAAQTQPSEAGFNAFLVDEWCVRREHWFSDMHRAHEAFETVCDESPSISS